MKRIAAILLAIACMISLLACGGGDVSEVGIKEFTSEIYTHKEIESAIDEILHYFKKNFDGCTLREITYAGDEKTLAHAEWAERHDADDVIVLISTFDVDGSGGDGSLNPNSTYTRWMWILVRDGKGRWKHVDHGY
ncbi:MAG: hypothetical protein IKT45_07175 [Lachnospiraceae bacterium]|nr:hypothetical protein [Lachnospiraceae bacterium]